MIRAALALLVFLVTTASAHHAAACAGCSNPNLPTARVGSASLRANEVNAAIHLTATTMHVVHAEHCPDIGPICRVRAEPPQLHDQRFYVAEVRPIVAFGITNAFGVEAQAPMRLLHTTIVFRRLDGTPFTPDYEHIHHRDETLFGLADPWLLARAFGAVGDLAVTTRAGFALPLGSTVPDPFALGRAGLSHQHVQFGTGTVYPVFAVDASLPVGRARLDAYGQSAIFVAENGYGYRAGNRYLAGMSGSLEVAPRLRVGIGADVLNEQPERWHGVVQQDGNVGRTDVLAGGSVAYVVGRAALSLAIKVPVYQHFIETSVHGGDPGQLTYPAIVNVSAQTSFDR